MSNLPNGWTSVALGDILADGPTNGYSPQSTPDATGTLTLRLSATTTGQLILNEETTKRLAELIPDDSKFWLEPGDVLVQRANALEYVGTAAVYDGPPRTYVYPDLMMRIRPMRALVDGSYLWRYINSQGAKKYWRDRATGTAGNMPKINGTTLRELPVLLPPLAEQRRIFTKIESLTLRSRRAKEALDAIPPLLERFRKSVLAAAFRGDLTADWRAKNPDVEPAEELLKRIRAERRRRWEEAELAKMRAKGKVPGDDRWKERYEEPTPVDASDLPELPEGWCWSSIGELASVGTGTTPSRSEPSYYGGTIPWVTSGALNDMFVKSTSEFVTQKALRETSLTLYPPHTLLVAMYGEGKTRGKVSELLIEAATNQAVAAILTADSASLVRPHMKLWLLKGYEELRLVSSGGVQPNLNLDKVRSIVVPLAPLLEQRAMLRCVEGSLAVYESMRSLAVSVCADIVLFDQATLAKAFRGELVPQDPNDEPASALLERLRAQAAQSASPATTGARRRGATGSSFAKAPEPEPSERTTAAAKRRAQAPAHPRRQ